MIPPAGKTKSLSQLRRLCCYLGPSYNNSISLVPQCEVAVIVRCVPAVSHEGVVVIPGM